MDAGDWLAVGALVVAVIALIHSIVTSQAQTKIDVKVKMHEAAPNRGLGEPHYYINVTNHSLGREVEITHVWFQDGEQKIHVIQPERPLPKRLRVGESWETWHIQNTLPQSILQDPFKSGRVRLSNDTVLKTTFNKGVPSDGFVPGNQS